MLSKTLSALCLVIALSSTASFAEDQKNAFNKGGSPVVTKSGDCVLTKWQGEGACGKPAPAPEPVPVAQPAPPPAPEIQYEKRVVYFDFNKTTLTSDAVAKLDELINLMAGYTNITKAEVVGFADEIGAQDKNYRLGENRGYAVRDYIASRTNIPVEAVGVKSLGEDSPTAKCEGIKQRIKKIECLGPDRRVEVEFTYER